MAETEFQFPALTNINLYRVEQYQQERLKEMQQNAKWPGGLHAYRECVWVPGLNQPEERFESMSI